MGVIEAIRSKTLTGSEPANPETHSATCLNCGAALGGPFCARCGQRDIPPYPSVRDLVIDAFWELSGWDGRFASTVRALIRRPGMLTREFLEGRRARYLSPLRLYLMASLLYFVLAAAAPDVRLGSGKSAFFVGIKPSPTAAGKSRPERVADAVSGSLRPSDPDPDPGSDGAAKPASVLTEEERAAALKDIERAPSLMRPFLRRAVADPAGFKRGMIQTMPRMLFALLPVFAGIVALFYRGRKYPEHLYFAIHLHAFVFLAIAIVEAAKFTRLPGLVAALGAVAFVWIPTYATFAFKRTYGGSVIATLAKEVGIGAIYAFASFAAFVVTLYWVSVYG